MSETGKIIALLAFGLSATSAYAQVSGQTQSNQPLHSAPWPSASLIPGIVFSGDGAVEVEQEAGALPVITFWRPVLYKEVSKRPVAGRMNCRVVAVELPYIEEALDVQARYRADAESRKQRGFRDEHRRVNDSGPIKQLDIIGHRKDPHEHYVLSYIVVADGNRLIDIRRNCTFVHDNGAGKPDYPAYIGRYTALTFGFVPTVFETDTPS